MIAQLAGDSFLLAAILSSVCAFFAAAGFAFFFFGTPHDVIIAGICGCLGWFVYLVSKHLELSITASYAVGSFAVGVASEISAVIWKRPATVYIVPGLIPLVPGGGMYETMLAAVTGNIDRALTAGFETLCAAGAIAAGVAAVAALFRLVSATQRR